MSDLKFDYKQIFNLEKIRIEQEKIILEKQKKQEEKEKIFKSKGIDFNASKNQKKKQGVITQKATDPKKNKFKLKGVISKNKFKINTIAAMNSLQDKNYTRDVEEITEKIINRTDFVVFMSNQDKRKSLQRSKTFGQDQIKTHLQRITNIR